MLGMVVEEGEVISEGIELTVVLGLFEGMLVPDIGWGLLEGMVLLSIGFVLLEGTVVLGIFEGMLVLDIGLRLLDGFVVPHKGISQVAHRTFGSTV